MYSLNVYRAKQSGEFALVFNHAVNNGSQDEFHREAHFPSIHNNAGGTAHEGVMNHAQQVAAVSYTHLTLPTN